MTDPDLNQLLEENFKYIEDIIDSRKLLGQYNVPKNFNSHTRYAYSHSSGINEAAQRFEDTIVANEGDSLNNCNIKKTDSEVTVVRVKCGEGTIKKRKSKWDMHDIAVPGDGSHLGESPSLVNLVTFVGDVQPLHGEFQEYMVPLSSWEPYIKIDEYLYRPEAKSSNKNIEKMSEIKVKTSGNIISRRPSWANKISKFIRRHISYKEPKSSSTESKN